ncbi:MAG: TonB-dependent receptor [Crocinitomicaceae bacterium]|nr:TonB-dependent receptor [Crocinitomicaceae bacterium]
MRAILFALIILLFSNSGNAQEITGTIKGIVIDELSEEPIVGAKIILLDSDPTVGAFSDVDGLFRIENIPSGRHGIQISFIGYKPVTMLNLEVLTKELDFEIKMVSLVKDIGEVTVRANNTEEVSNNMVTNSGRSFAIEESQRYAGSLGDVSRMAQNFAGVQGSNDTRNDIIVRGNSPTGVLYRLEGIDIPNPNHFANFGTTGGPISMINPNMLTKSDFMTGAFPAEYGNANAGVFDLKLRNGNAEKFEFLAQVGFNGFEGMAEGPFSKKSRASFVINYRYSVIELLQLMGINFGSSSLPKYQDLSFKINIPSKQGVTSIFGIGGISEVDLLSSTPGDEDELFGESGVDTYFTGMTGFFGINHKQRINSNSFLRFNLGVQAATNVIQNDTLDINYENPFTTYFKDALQGKQTTGIHYINKLNSRHFIKAGIFADYLFFNLIDSVYRSELNGFVPLHDTQSGTMLFQPYLAYQYKISDDVTLNAGLHYQHLLIDNQWNLEPRFGILWSMNERNNISFAYGYHSQMQPLEMYFQENQIGPNEFVQSNNSIGFTKSHHGVIGYSTYFKHGIHLKFEGYGQYIHNAPVEIKTSAYSMLNYGADFYTVIPDSMSNAGTGTNYGLEITLEKRMEKGFYFMFNGSLFESRYKGSDGVERNTGFNGNYTTNLLGGYEFRFNENKGLNKRGKAKPIIALAADVKFVMNGGGRYTPLLLQESGIAGEEVRDLTRINEAQYPVYYKLNVRISFKFIMKKTTQELAFDIQNVTNRRNVFYQAYEAETNSIRTTYQTGLLPLVQFRVYF